MVTLDMFIMRLYGIKRLENENNGRVVAGDKFLAGHKKALGWPRVARGPLFARPCCRKASRSQDVG